MKLSTAILATTVLIVLPQTAFAGSANTSEKISACTDEIQTQLGASDAQLEFKTVKGNSRVKTLSFRIEAGGERDKVTCKVRRDDTVEVVWGKTVKPKMDKAVQANVKTNAGE